MLKFLRRRGFVYREGRNWTERHHKWLRRLVREEALPSEDGTVLEEYLALLDYKLARRAELDRRIEELAFSDAYRAAVERLRCFRGIESRRPKTGPGLQCRGRDSNPHGPKPRGF